MNYYTVYLNKNDRIAAHGSAKECAEKLGLTVGSFYSMVTRLDEYGRGSKYTVVKESGQEE